MNTELAYAVIEPGVTQEMLYKHLTDRNLPLMLDVSSSSPDASLIGNMIERGFGHTPYADHFNHCCALEVMLADGSIVQTGFGHFGNSRATNVHRWGLGPTIDGLFSQSNFGIVIQATIWLMPNPEAQGLFLLHIDTDQDLLPAMESLRDLKLNRVLTGAVHVINDMRLVSTFQRYPFEETNGITPLPTLHLDRLKKKWGVSSWNMLGGMWGTQSQITAEIKEIKRKLRDKGRLTVISSEQLARAERYPSFARLLGVRELKQKQAIFKLLRGNPTHAALRSAYWRKRSLPTHCTFEDPSKDRCGILWYAPVIPAERGALEEFLRVSRSIYKFSHFEYNVTFNFTNPRSCSCTLGIQFDPDVESEAVAANECYRLLSKELTRSGFYPYRLGSNCDEVESILYPKTDVYRDFCRALKNVVDPDHILSPGRYMIS